MSHITRGVPTIFDNGQYIITMAIKGICDTCSFWVKSNEAYLEIQNHILLINIKMPKIVGIFTIMSMIKVFTDYL